MRRIKVLLVSNQRPNKIGIGNPIIIRIKESMQRDKRIDNIVFIPFDNHFHTLLSIRREAFKADITHVHFGGLYALAIRFFLIGLKKSIFITFHGTDIHAKSIRTTKNLIKRLKIKLNQYASFACIALFDKVGFVADEMIHYVPNSLNKQINKKAFIEHLGVDYKLFVPISKQEACRYLGIPSGKYVLFSDISNSSIKRRDIAESIIKELGQDYKLLIMCGISPALVPYYINSCDFLLLTSDEEGSPNIIRECLALNKPVFSVEVGDSRQQLNGLHNSCIISRNPAEAAKQINNYLKKEYQDNTRVSLRTVLDFDETNKPIITLYTNQINKV